MIDRWRSLSRHFNQESTVSRTWRYWRKLCQEAAWTSRLSVLRTSTTPTWRPQCCTRLPAAAASSARNWTALMSAVWKRWGLGDGRQVGTLLQSTLQTSSIAFSVHFLYMISTLVPIMLWIAIGHPNRLNNAKKSKFIQETAQGVFPHD